MFVQVIGFKYLESLVRSEKRKENNQKNYATHFFANNNFANFDTFCI